MRSFRARFPLDGEGLADVVDVAHEPGTIDRTLRPNQILAVGGLPYSVVDGRLAREIVERVESELLTPFGLRTLGCGEPGYRGRYAGPPAERDRAYHQGTAWPWLLGPFAEAWLRVRGDAPSARATLRARLVAPWLAQLETAGLGHVSEFVDGDFPHMPRGAPFQAWSLGELVRVLALLESERRVG